MMDTSVDVIHHHSVDPLVGERKKRERREKDRGRREKEREKKEIREGTIKCDAIRNREVEKKEERETGNDSCV